MKALLALLLVSAAAPAQLTTASPAVQSTCASTSATPLPADMADLPVPATYPTCDSYSLYDKKDYSGARTCAIQERLALLARLPDSPAKAEPADEANDGRDPAGGLVVLSQLYANAEGVTRNPALAARFFCEAIDTNEVEHDPDPASTKNILGTLQRLREIVSTSPHFSLCVTTGTNFPDNTTSQPPDSTPESRYCMSKSGQEWEVQYPAIHAGGIQDADDAAHKAATDAAAALKPALRKLTPIQRAAYKRLTAALDLFIAKQVTGEVLAPGPYGDSGLYPDYDHADLDTRVAAFLKHPPPVPKPAALATADAALNKVYRDLLANPEALAKNLELSLHVSPDDLRTEERAWLAYRDTFVAFGKTLRPDLPASAWLLPLTAARTSDLRQVYNVINNKL